MHSAQVSRFRRLKILLINPIQSPTRKPYLGIGLAYDEVSGIVFRRHGELHQTPPRLRPADLDGIERYGVRRFMMADDLSCVDRRWVHESCWRIIELDLGIEFRTAGRANIIDRELAQAGRLLRVGHGV